MRERGYLRSILTGESRAYGFTIAFWGSGAMLINVHGVPELFEALLYGFGAVLGFGILAVIAFRSALAKPETSDSNLLVLSSIHYIASLLPMVIAYLISKNFSSLYAFLITGFEVTLVYNCSMLLERLLSEEIYSLETKIESNLG
jgi:hypothetical protein